MIDLNEISPEEFHEAYRKSKTTLSKQDILGYALQTGQITLTTYYRHHEYTGRKITNTEDISDWLHTLPDSLR